MYGGADGGLRIRTIEGLGPVGREYNTVIYSGYDGQETLDSRALPRAITMSVEFCGKNIAERVKSALLVFGEAGNLIIENGNTARKIFCNQVTVEDPQRILRGQISVLSVQFVCDNPFFEDEEDTVVPLYQRTKLLSTPFSLPAMFGDIVMGATIYVSAPSFIEPVISLYYPAALSDAEYIIITNATTGASLRLDYIPSDEDTVTVNIKDRRVFSSVNGNIINMLSDDTFLGDFVLKNGINVLTVDMGDTATGFIAECRYSNVYGEAVIV